MSETQEQYGNGAEKRPLTAVEYLENICHDFIHPMHGAEFWQQVKTEIEKP